MSQHEMQDEMEHKAGAVASAGNLLWQVYLLGVVAVCIPWVSWDVAKSLGSSAPLQVIVGLAAIASYAAHRASCSETGRYLLSRIEDPFGLPDTKSGIMPCLLPILLLGIEVGMMVWYALSPLLKV